jgi:hypothetical protein
MNPFLTGPILVWQARERLHDVCEERLELRIRISQEIAKKLRRVQNLESLRICRSVSLEEALEAALDAYLNPNDPDQSSQQQVKKIA